MIGWIYRRNPFHLFYVPLSEARLSILHALRQNTGALRTERLAELTLDPANLSSDIRYLESRHYVNYYYHNGRNSPPDTTTVFITAAGEDALKPLWVRNDQIALSFLGIIGSLLVGWATSQYSFRLANRSQLALQDPNVQISLGSIDDLGIIRVSSDTITTTVTNIGPTDVQDIDIYIDEFHATANLSEIRPDYLQGLPIFHLPLLRVGQSRVFQFGRDKLIWKNIFLNEESYRKNHEGKFLLFCRVYTRCRRTSDKKAFAFADVYYAQRTALVPWRVPSSREEFLPHRLL